MGWWSETIMGGDSPLDIQDGIYAMLNIEKFPKDNDGRADIPKEILEKEQDRIVESLPDDEDLNIGLQVVGIMMMEVGAKISDKNKQLIIKAAENDEWAKEDNKRRKYIEDFISALEKFDGTVPLKTTSEGLFEALNKQSRGGLINKNI